MVGVVVVNLGFDLIQHLTDIGLFEAQPQAFAQELRTVHAAPGVACFAIATPGGEFQQGIRVGGETDGDVAIPLVVARGDGVVVAVFVIVGMRLVADHSHITQWATGGGIDDFIEAPVGAGQHTGVDPCAQLAELLRLALEQDSTGRRARAPEHGLWTFDHRELVVGLRRDIRGGRIHSARAGAEHHAAIGEDIQARAEHAAQHRVAVGTAVAHEGEAGDGLEVVAAVTGRHWLARVFRVGNHGQRRAGRDRRDDGGAQFVIFSLCLWHQQCAKQNSENGGASHTGVSRKPGHEKFHQSFVNNTASSLRLSV